MSTLVTSAVTAVDKIPLGRRIEEIKKHMGSYYSNVAMATRLGIHDETLRLMLKGKRDIYTFELEKIANDLKITVDRIVQEDIRQDTEQLVQSLNESVNPQVSLQLASQLANQAIGLTERCHALHRLGRAYFYTYRFDESNQILTEAHEMALKIKEQYEETDVLYNVLFHLMDSFTAKKEYENAARILESVRPHFLMTPTRCAAISYQMAKIEEQRGNIHSAKQFAIDSLNCAKQAERPIIISKAQLNLAHFEYLGSDYEKSEKWLELAIEGLGQDAKTQLIARKELVKSLLKLGKKDRALHEIELALTEAREINWSEMLGKLSILLSVATGQPQHAQAVLEDTRNQLKIRFLASKCLKCHYKAIGDGSMFLHYYEVAETFCSQMSDILDEGEL